ncbi:dTDP-4-amino-4,6-dideoxygalactose transaminase [Vibrio splendidus]|uniref:dTDP-4-amino-4,6-dideoxygalactose transaminase n=1 Tax=Vibrio splendidus TaxID=29497 RepID=UPI00246905AB|nr:dTDP-4-amino-4,6-dideoxygalactose transaminase [Vibrio splendidus]MDH5888514.1 dTDP-4-amino-4,6-dideoxygalactose transaminase [Vibrio splendidus]
MILFNKAPSVGSELDYISQAISSGHLCGDREFGKLCELWFEEKFSCIKTLMTPSCTAALELAALILDIQPGDEVIVPSYTFVSSANAFVLRGAKIIFVDIRPDTMNIDETKIEAAITNKTKVIVPVHYAGVACEMDIIMNIAKKYNLFVVEDAAQAVMSTYNGKALGTLGHLGTYSFHETKNYTSGGEGGLLLINDERFVDKAEIIREKGTNRKEFIQGMVDKYTWVNVGSSFLPSDIQSAFLFAQLNNAKLINDKRLLDWKRYYDAFLPYTESHGVDLPVIPRYCSHNAHMFYFKLNSVDDRNLFISKLKALGVTSSFHYVPLHSSPGGLRFGEFVGEDIYTTIESERLVRLPMYFNLSESDQEKIIYSVKFVLENELRSI